MKRTSLLSSLCLCSLLTVAQTELPVNEAKTMTSSKSYSEVSIHDPSVVYNPAKQNYYIVGSHRGFANSTDLVNLKGLNSNNMYNTSYAKAFKSSPEHKVQVMRDGVITTDTLKSCDAAAFCATYAGIKVGDREPTTESGWLSGNQWAPDLIYNPNMGKWCMYLSLNGDNWASVIVMLTSDSPDGPFTYQAPIVFGGFNNQKYSGVSVDYKDTDLPLVIGHDEELPTRYNTSAWGNLWPNCIDPCVFFDDNGELWLAYGSWSGGIFILKLDKNTGLRDYTTTYEMSTYKGKAPNGSSYTGYLSDPYFGKLIAGGAYVSGEGPYIQKIGNYYYLFVTYGGLNPDAGYEMRIFRSETPDGNYVDGTNASARYTDYVLNYGPNARTNKGLKIIGAMNNWGTMTVGECAEGHNSALVDPEGDAFVVYHTKFNDGTYGHQVRVRQLFVNEIGWLVASPFRYTGKQTRQADIESKQLFTPEEIAGTYNLILHPYRLNHNNMQEATPIKVTLGADGTVTGERPGTWEYTQEGKSYVKLVLKAGTYYGVVMKQNVDGYTDMPAICFTAVGNGGAPVWLYKYEPKAAVAAQYAALEDYFGYETTSIKGDAPIIDNVEIEFEATNAETGAAEPETFSSMGIFTPTEDGHKISVSAEWYAADYFMKAGPYTRPTRNASGEMHTEVYYPESTNKNITAGWWSNFSKEDYVIEQNMTIEFHFYNYSDEADNWHNWALYGASATHGASGYKEYFGIRNDNWDNTTGSNAGCTSNFNWDTFKADMNGSLVNMTVNYSDTGVFTMESDITTQSGKVYNYSYTKTLTDHPAKLTLFFVNEKSYIDGSSLGVSDVVIDSSAVDDKTYNIYGQEVDESYKGIVIRNGKKFIQK